MPSADGHVPAPRGPTRGAPRPRHAPRCAAEPRSERRRVWRRRRCRPDSEAPQLPRPELPRRVRWRPIRSRVARDLDAGSRSPPGRPSAATRLRRYRAREGSQSRATPPRRPHGRPRWVAGASPPPSLGDCAGAARSAQRPGSGAKLRAVSAPALARRRASGADVDGALCGFRWLHGRSATGSDRTGFAGHRQRHGPPADRSAAPAETFQELLKSAVRNDPQPARARNTSRSNWNSTRSGSSETTVPWRTPR